MELMALLDLLSFSPQRLNLSFFGTCSTPLTLDCALQGLGLLHCRALFPKELDRTTPWGSIIINMILQGCFQTQGKEKKKKR